MLVRIERLCLVTFLTVFEIIVARKSPSSKYNRAFSWRQSSPWKKNDPSCCSQLLQSCPLLLLANRGGAESTSPIHNEPLNNITSQTEAMGAEQQCSSSSSSSSSSSPYVFGAAKHGDGSETDPDGLPRRFLIMQKGDRAAAIKAFAATKRWREENKVDTILGRPHPKYNQCKRIVPSFFCDQDLHGNPVFVQHLGKMDLEYADQCGCTEDDVLNHYVYIFEYCWNIFEPKVSPKEGVMTSVLNLDGVGWKTYNNKKHKVFFKRMVSLMSSHYPTRSYKTFVINVPTWFQIGFSILKPLLRRSTREKISIYSKGAAQDRALIKLLGNALPPELLCTEAEKSSYVENNANNTKTGKHSQIEEDIMSFCLSRLKTEGLIMELADD